MDRHMRAQHGKTFQCDQCPKKYPALGANKLLLVLMHPLVLPQESAARVLLGALVTLKSFSMLRSHVSVHANISEINSWAFLTLNGQFLMCWLQMVLNTDP